MTNEPLYHSAVDRKRT